VHSTAYRRPSELAPGPTLVVGASHCDIAYEVAADRPTFLVGPDQGQVPLDCNSPMIRVALPIIVFVWLHLLTRRNRLRSEPSRARSRSHGYGQRCRLPLLGILGL
jgi:putative flavoprotein involved in K+ transport